MMDMQTPCQWVLFVWFSFAQVEVAIAIGSGLFANPYASHFPSYGSSGSFGIQPDIVGQIYGSPFQSMQTPGGHVNLPLMPDHSHLTSQYYSLPLNTGGTHHSDLKSGNDIANELTQALLRGDKKQETFRVPSKPTIDPYSILQSSINDLGKPKTALPPVGKGYAYMSIVQDSSIQPRPAEGVIHEPLHDDELHSGQVGDYEGENSENLHDEDEELLHLSKAKKPKRIKDTPFDYDHHDNPPGKTTIELSSIRYEDDFRPSKPYPHPEDITTKRPYPVRTDLHGYRENIDHPKGAVLSESDHEDSGHYDHGPVRLHELQNGESYDDHPEHDEEHHHGKKFHKDHDSAKNHDKIESTGDKPSKNYEHQDNHDEESGPHDDNGDHDYKKPNDVASYETGPAYEENEHQSDYGHDHDEEAGIDDNKEYDKTYPDKESNKHKFNSNYGTFESRNKNKGLENPKENQDREPPAEYEKLVETHHVPAYEDEEHDGSDDFQTPTTGNLPGIRPGRPNNFKSHEHASHHATPNYDDGEEIRPEYLDSSNKPGPHFRDQNNPYHQPSHNKEPKETRINQERPRRPNYGRPYDDYLDQNSNADEPHKTPLKLQRPAPNPPKPASHYEYRPKLPAVDPGNKYGYPKGYRPYQNELSYVRPKGKERPREVDYQGSNDLQRPALAPKPNNILQDDEDDQHENTGPYYDVNFHRPPPGFTNGDYRTPEEKPRTNGGPPPRYPQGGPPERPFQGSGRSPMRFITNFFRRPY